MKLFDLTYKNGRWIIRKIYLNKKRRATGKTVFKSKEYPSWHLARLRGADWKELRQWEKRV